MSILSPYEDLSAWNVVKVGGTPLPGVLISINGIKRVYEWVIQKGLGLAGAATIFRGSLLTDDITIVCKLTDKDEFKACHSFDGAITPKKGQKPTAFDIQNAAFQWVQINKVAFKERPAPAYSGAGGWQVEYKLIEYAKAIKIAVGPADPAKVDGPPKPKDAAEAAIQDILKQIETS